MIRCPGSEATQSGGSCSACWPAPILATKPNRAPALRLCTAVVQTRRRTKIGPCLTLRLRFPNDIVIRTYHLRKSFVSNLWLFPTTMANGHFAYDQSGREASCPHCEQFENTCVFVVIQLNFSPPAFLRNGAHWSSGPTGPSRASGRPHLHGTTGNAQRDPRLARYASDPTRMTRSRISACIARISVATSSCQIEAKTSRTS
jgi:hypothetical protein